MLGVGRKLAKRILSTQPVITPDFRTAAYLSFAHRLPDRIGMLSAKLSGM